MKEYQIEIHETSSRIITVNAEDEYEALDRVQIEYTDGEHVLDDSDFQDTQFNIL